MAETTGSIGDKMVGGMPSFSSATSNRDEEIDTNQHEPSAAQYRQNNMFLQRYTDHTYHDFAAYLREGGKIEKHKKCDRNFPARLHQILSDEQYAHVISWMPHGRAWKVLDKKLLVDEVIPKFFGQSKFASFTRQLSGWGFKRLHQTGPDLGCYYHECFLRGHPRLTILMRRVSPGKGKATPNVHAEPDFYVIAEQYPLENPSNVAGEAAAVTGPTKNYQWDSHDQIDGKPPQHAAAAYQKKESNCSIQLQHKKSKSVDRHHSNHSNPSSDETREELERRTESHTQEEMNYFDYYAMSNHLSVDHFSSVQPNQEAIMNQYYAGNVYQHTPGSLQHGAAAHYFPHPQYSQQQQQQQQQHVHDSYRYTNPYYSNFYNDGQMMPQGPILHGQALHQASSMSTPQMGYPAQAQEYNQFFPPNSSSYNSYFEDKSEDKGYEKYF